MTTSGAKLGLLLGFVGMCLFAGLPATRLAVSGFDPWFLTVARAALAGSAALVVLLVLRRRVPPRSLWLEIFFAALCTVVGFPLFAALGDDDRAGRTWWRCTRYPTTCHRRRGRDLCP